MEELRNPIRITDNIYLESNLSAESIVKMVRLMLRKYGIEEEEVTINIAEKEEEGLSETEKQRIEFWKGLLDKTNKKIKYFSNNIPKKYYDIYCTSEVPGLYFYYAIRQTSASIGLSIQRGTKELNDKIFVQLLQNKDEIEKYFGEKLLWTNNEEKKSSWIYKRYEYAGLKNVDKWEQLQNDMVNGMVRFTNTFQKYIEKII
jgi:predicted RNA-binding protein Jag